MFTFQTPGIVQGQEGGMKFKLLEIDDFSMYWDTDAAQYGDMDMKELRVSFGFGLGRERSVGRE